MNGKFKLRRLVKGMTQYQLEGLTGIKQSMISLYERGIRMPNEEQKIRICSALNCKIKDIFSEGEKEK